MTCFSRHLKITQLMDRFVLFETEQNKSMEMSDGVGADVKHNIASI